MAAPQTDIVNGIESIEVAFRNPDGTVNEASWFRIEDIEEGSVTLTSNQETETNITPEDKDVPILTIYTPAAGDVFNFALLQVSARNLQLYWNVKYDPTISMTTIMAKKKHANLAIRMISRPQEGIKVMLQFRNTVSLAAWKNNITKTGLLAISLAATIRAWKDADGDDATMEVQTLNEDGTPFNAVSAFDTLQAFTSAVTATSEGVTTTVTATNANTKFEFNAIDDPEGTPQTMTLKLEGVQVAAVSYPSDYQGQPFKFTDSASNVYYGVFTNGTFNL